ncbi:MAG TPA: hypothetical protein DCF62_08260 [Porticoccaceae bacterium]|nr:hypothetical protein [Porticoccaceae bacterium]
MRRAYVLLTVFILLAAYYVQREHGDLDELINTLVIRYQAIKNNSESELGPEMEATFTSYELPTRDQRHLISLLTEGKFIELEQLYGQYYSQFSENVVYEGKIVDAYGIFDFEEHLFPKVELWQHHFPESPHPRLAKGILYFHLGWKARGNKLSSNTLEEQFKGMHHYFELAEHEIRGTIAINPNLSPAYCKLLKIAAASGDREDKYYWYREGIKQIPHSYHVRECYLEKLAPKWGGSYEEIDNFVSRSIQDHKENPRLLLLKALAGYIRAGGYRGDQLYEKALIEINESISYVKRWNNYYKRTQVYMDLGENQLALEDINEALVARPGAFYLLVKKA